MRIDNRVLAIPAPCRKLVPTFRCEHTQKGEHSLACAHTRRRGHPSGQYRIRTGPMVSTARNRSHGGGSPLAEKAAVKASVNKPISVPLADAAAAAPPASASAIVKQPPRRCGRRMTAGCRRSAQRRTWRRLAAAGSAATDRWRSDVVAPARARAGAHPLAPREADELRDQLARAKERVERRTACGRRSGASWWRRTSGSSPSSRPPRASTSSAPPRSARSSSTHAKRSRS